MYTLYGYAKSSCTQRVKTVLNYKNLKYNYVSLDFSQRKQMTDEYKKIHPRQVLPSLVTEEGVNLIESVAIIDYLEDKYPQNSLLPKDPQLQYQVRSICEFINSSIQPYQHPLIFNYINSQSEQQITWKDQWYEWNMRGIKYIDDQIKSTKGKYCFGDTLTLADVFVFCQIDSAFTRFQFDFSPFKNVMDVVKNAQQIPEIEQARGIYSPDFQQ
ncbi:hypothetical protein pb186bvf_001202 [Paramecium bursaria]